MNSDKANNVGLKCIIVFISIIKFNKDWFDVQYLYNALQFDVGKIAHN